MELSVIYKSWIAGFPSSGWKAITGYILNGSVLKLGPPSKYLSEKYTVLVNKHQIL